MMKLFALLSKFL